MGSSLDQFRVLRRTFPGRVFLSSVLLWAALRLTQNFVPLPMIIEIFRKLVSLALIASAIWLIAVNLVRNQRMFLWRVRRKLILSYVLLGLVPVVLVALLSLIGGFVLYDRIAPYLFGEGYDDIAEEVHQIAVTTAAEIARQPASAARVLELKAANLAPRYPGISFAVVRPNGTGPTPLLIDPSRILASGPWRHQPAPVVIPSWIVAAHGFRGNLAMPAPEGAGNMRLDIRAVELLADGAAVVVDLPVDTALIDRLAEQTATRVLSVQLIPDDMPAAVPPAAAPTAPAPITKGIPFRQTGAGLTYTDWLTGDSGRVYVTLYAPAARLYSLMATAPAARLVALNYDFFIWALIALGATLFVVQSVALVFGAWLARQITSAVHALSVGTERVRQGDFGYRIPIESNDQLGELSDSFNRMNSSIEQGLVVLRDKQRLEDELRIAREIQKSLLPTSPPVMPGLELAELCEPAREVGGDYYDFFELGPRQLGVLIADVSGKGTSAALYMAELKGIMLALSHSESSPRRLLMNVNHLLSDHFDNRSFITATYAVIDLDAGTLTYARAGHPPLIVVSDGKTEIAVPDGMVLGLRIPGASRRFDEILVEHTQRIGSGDVVVFYTDGITEAMNSAGDLFSDEALAHVVCESQHLDAHAIRARVLERVRAFVGDAEPHDDMTMVVLKLS